MIKMYDIFHIGNFLNIFFDKLNYKKKEEGFA